MVGRRGEQLVVHITGMDELLDEIGQVVTLREAGQLVRVLQPRVHHEVDLQSTRRLKNSSAEVS